MRANITLEDNVVYIETEKGMLKTIVDDISPSNSELRIPTEFFKLLVDDVDWAWKLLKEVSKTDIFHDVRFDILKTAAGKGFDAAASTLNSYIGNAPNGKPKMYISQNRNPYDKTESVEITDGDFCVHLYVCEAEQGSINLPPNVYQYRRKSFDIKKKHFEKIPGDLEGFFKFVKTLASFSAITSQRMDECLEKYFEEKDCAIQMLKEIERDCAHRGERDSVCRKIEAGDVAEVPGGYMVFLPFENFYYVQDNGRVLRIKGYNSTAVKENVLKLHKGKPLKEKWLEEVSDSGELTDVARKIGKVRPDLMVVI